MYHLPLYAALYVLCISYGIRYVIRLFSRGMIETYRYLAVAPHCCHSKEERDMQVLLNVVSVFNICEVYMLIEASKDLLVFSIGDVTCCIEYRFFQNRFQNRIQILVQ